MIDLSSLRIFSGYASREQGRCLRRDPHERPRLFHRARGLNAEPRAAADNFVVVSRAEIGTVLKPDGKGVGLRPAH